MQNLRIIAMIGLITFSLFVTINNGLAARGNPYPSSGDSVSKWEKRFKPVLDRVPGNTKVLGYVADWDIPNAEYEIIDQETEYTLTQYALAPRAVQPGLDHEWIIGNFTKPGFEDWLNQNLPSYEISELGFGIYLIHRNPQ
jgi:hypothetical protein